MSVLKTGKPASVSAISISFHGVGNTTKLCSPRENMRDHRMQAQWSKYPKLFLRYLRCTVQPENRCMYGTYVVPPVVEGLKNLPNLTLTFICNSTMCFVFSKYQIYHPLLKRIPQKLGQCRHPRTTRTKAKIKSFWYVIIHGPSIFYILVRYIYIICYWFLYQYIYLFYYLIFE